MDNRTMYKLSYGLFVLTAKDDVKDNGCITNTAIQVTSSPNQISIAVNKSNYTCAMIEKTKMFNISIIDEKASFDLFKHFGFQKGSEVDKFKDFKDCNRSSNGIYYITNGTNAYISVNVTNIVDLGTHLMFIGDVIDMEVLNNNKSATYEYYMNNIKPKPEESKKASKSKTLWRCTICGYEVEADADTLPSDFVCPSCGHPASDFEKI